MKNNGMGSQDEESRGFPLGPDYHTSPTERVSSIFSGVESAKSALHPEQFGPVSKEPVPNEHEQRRYEPSEGQME